MAHGNVSKVCAWSQWMRCNVNGNNVNYDCWKSVIKCWSCQAWLLGADGWDGGSISWGEHTIDITVLAAFKWFQDFSPNMNILKGSWLFFKSNVKWSHTWLDLNWIDKGRCHMSPKSKMFWFCSIFNFFILKTLQTQNVLIWLVSINCELQGPWRARSGCSTRSPPARSPAGSRRRPREEVRGAVAWAGGSAGWSPCGGCCWGPPAWTRADSSTGRSRDTLWISPLVRTTTSMSTDL